MLLTYEMLRAKGACADQADKFRDLFPAGVVLTEALCVAYAKEFEFECAARNLLSASARDAYYKACGTARDAYEEAYTTVQDACGKAIAVAWEAYGKARVTARDAYYKARARALDAYDKARAAAFFAAWQADNAP